MRYICANRREKWSESNIMSVFWLDRRSAWGWSWHSINLWVALHLSPSSCFSKKETSKSKKEAEDYERERDHNHHTHLRSSSSSSSSS
ncbi:hypothetical protein VIGAN_03008100 [Vigna angularis var. angularis]|uniref:Uncharacterized protein n=1 Tax=Vigna angularis var. angularis TaxID=157739 RepID=A0A0S3RJ45_PHAAN|nr:hypothetical protein VIGAN_03008100 [Vigna angularis var. angularis]